MVPHLPRRRVPGPIWRVPPAVMWVPLDADRSIDAATELAGERRWKKARLHAGSSCASGFPSGETSGAVAVRVIEEDAMGAFVDGSSCVCCNSSAPFTPHSPTPGIPQACAPSMSCDVSDGCAPVRSSMLIWPPVLRQPMSMPTGVSTMLWSTPPASPAGTHASCVLRLTKGSGAKPSKLVCSMPWEASSAFKTPREVSICVLTCACDCSRLSTAMPLVTTPSRSAPPMDSRLCAAESEFHSSLASPPNMGSAGKPGSLAGGMPGGSGPAGGAGGMSSTSGSTTGPMMLVRKGHNTCQAERV